MVFESYVVDILNKFLGQYVENLDPSQFQMSIWGGDVKLENLVLKENALDEFDLPVKVLRGHLGRLILKIPWKNLYSEPVVAKVDGVYILARPNTDIKYNHEKEEKIKQSKKQQELSAIEEAIKYAEESKNKTAEEKEKSMNFAEKLAMHVVKNIQVFVSNIHIRYEDSVSNEDGPFSLGITLENLSAESVDDFWQPIVVDSKQTLVNKLVKLDNLALYLNSHDAIGDLPTIKNWVNIAKAGIARGPGGTNRPEYYNYIVEPLTSKTKAKLDTNSIPTLSIPKVFVEIIMKDLDLVLSRYQYKDIMRLADNFDRMKTNSIYRKYKPFIPLKEGPKLWWNYAIRSILEEDVKRRARNWSWKHIVSFRMMCHRYKKLYKEKLKAKKVPEKIEKDLEVLEQDLDVLNITICRRAAERETKKEGTNYELNEKRKKREGGLFSGFFGRKSKDKKTVAELTEEEQLAEWEKLYDAIGYSESENTVKLPKEYVAYKLMFGQKRMSVNLRDDTVTPALCISTINWEDLFVELSYRPGGQGLSVSSKMRHLNVVGCPIQNQSAPKIVRSVAEDTDVTDYVNASFETNPLDGKCDQRIRLAVQPLEVIYHANSVDRLMKFFKLPEDVQLSEISAAAYSQINGLRSQSRANLSYALETQTLLDVQILIHSPFVIIPEKGHLTENCSKLILDLGSLKVSSDPTQKRIKNTKSLSMEELEEKCYDRFAIELKQLQILMAKPGQNWKNVRNEEKSELHVLHPFGVDLQVQKCLAPNDVRLTQIRLTGSLSSLKFHLTDKNLQDLMQLALSIPIPGEEKSDKVTKATTQEPIFREVMTEAYVSPYNIVPERETESSEADEDFKTPPETPIGSLESSRSDISEVDEEALKLAKAGQTNVSLKFEILQINLTLATLDQFGIESPLLEVDLLRLGTQIAVRPYDLTVTVNIGDISLSEMLHGIDGAPLNLVCTPANLDIMALKFIQASRDNPRFKEMFNSTEQAIDVQFASLKVILHQEALLHLVEFANNLFPPSEEQIQGQQQEQLDAEPGGTTEDKDETDSKAVTRKTAQSSEEVVQLRVDARLGEFVATISSVRGDVAELQMKQLQVGLSILPDRTTVLARMQDLSIFDGMRDTLYRKIVTIVNEELFNVEVVIFNRATEGANYGNVEKVDTKLLMNVGRIRIIFLNRFVSDILAFVNNFQTAQEAIQNASKTAAKSASLSLQEYHKNSPRIKLDVAIQAPLVIVPVSSQSKRVLVADLGNLEVHNGFSVVQKGVGPDIVVVDNMVVSFTSLQVSVALMSDDENIVVQRLILKPISLELSLVRSLSTWYHEIPDIDVNGRLHAVNVHIGTDDVKTVLSITSQNLSEGAVIASDAGSIEMDSISERAVAVLEVEGDEAGEVVAAEEKSWVSVKFAFSIEKIAARIYRNTVELDVNNKSTWEHDSENCLSLFALEHFAVEGSILANGAMTTSVVLHTISLDDKRPAQEKGITTMIERRSENVSSLTHDDEQPPNMVDLEFEQTKDQDKTIRVSVKGLLIIVNVEFLLVLTGVFTSALEETDKKPTQIVTSEVLAEASHVAVDISSSVPVASTPRNQTPGLLVSLQVEEPEVVLLADAKQKYTDALILKNALDVKLRIKDEQMRFQSCIRNLEVISAAFEKSRRESTKSDVIQIEFINLHSSSRLGGRQHIDLHTSVVYVGISPAAVRIVSAVFGSFARSKEQDSATEDEDVPDLFKATDIASSDKWYLKEVARGQLVPGSRIFARCRDLTSYVPGLVTNIDHKVTAILDDGSNFSCDLNDVRGVVLDEPPLIKEVRAGTKIIALFKEGEPFRSGVVKKILESPDKNAPNVLVKFATKDEEVRPFEYIRLLKHVKSGASKVKPVVSSVVWARLPDYKHYGLGFISKKDWRYQVKFPDGTHLYHSLHDPLGLVLDRAPSTQAVSVGCDVIGCIPEKPLMYPGRVTKILEGSYQVQYDNGQTHENGIDDLRVLKVPESEGRRLVVGSLVWIKYMDNFYYRGFVDAIDYKIHVQFYEHEGKCSFALNDHVGLVLDVTPEEVKIGEEVLFLKDTYGLTGVVTKMEILETDPLYLIEGPSSELWASLKDIRRFGEYSGSKGVSSDSANNVESQEDNREDQLMVDVKGFVLKVEAEKGGNLMSLITMRGNIHAEVKDWSERLNGKADLQLEANYFNEELSEWEPLIEKLEDKNGFRPWGLSVGFKIGQDNGGSNGVDESESQIFLSVESEDSLELTVTKTNLNVFTELGKSFSEAVIEGVAGSSLEKTAPYEIKNELGVDVYIRPGKIFEPPEGLKSAVVLLRPDESLPLWFASRDGKLRLASMSSDFHSIGAGIQVEGYHELKDFSIKQASCAYFSIVPKKLHKQGFGGIVVDVSSPAGQKLVVIRSPFRIKNHCPIPLEIFVQQDNLELLRTLEQDSYLNVPLSIANNDLGYFIKPGGFPYEKTVEGIRLSELVQKKSKLYACAAPWPDADPFYIKVRCVSESYTSESGARTNQPCYTLHCYPPVVLHNYLPFHIYYKQQNLETFVKLDGGNELPIYTVNLNSNPGLDLKLDSYLGRTYTGNLRLRSDLAQLSIVYLCSDNKKLLVSLYVKKGGSLEITLYAQYWLINHSGLPLEYKASDSDAIIQHPAKQDDVAIFAFSAKSDKNTLQLRTSGSGWSDRFSLDIAGSGGSLKCTKDGKEYGIGSEIRLSYFSLTKVVLFTPLNLLVNQTKHVISLCECEQSQAEWYKAKPGETVPFWPNKTPATNLKIKTDNSPVESVPFNFQSNVNLLLRMENEVGAVCVTMFSKDAATVMTFTPYFEGSAPLRIDNDSSFEMSYRQVNSNKVYSIPSKMTTTFTWDNPQGRLEVEWFVVGQEKLSAKSNLQQNDMGTLGDDDNVVCHWACFLDGLQRVLYFTESYTMGFRAQQDQLEVPSQEVTLSLKGIGISLVNNKKSVELAYLSVSPSSVLWEEQNKRRWKTMTTQCCEALETAYKDLQNELSRGARPTYIRNVGNMTVDFEIMEILEPSRRPICRTFHPGIWLQFSQSAHEIQLHSKINDVQIDSQVPGSAFQTLFNSIPPPKTVAASNAPKPMIEASLITRTEENTVVSRIKYFKVLVQEIDVKMDKGWLMELLDLLERNSEGLDESNYEEDKKVVNTSVQSLNAAIVDVRNYYDYFHLSPLKVHISFSMQDSASDQRKQLTSNDLLLNSFGVAIANVQDVVLKLAYFELKSQIYSQSQLIQVAYNHYSSQAIKQAYVLVLGLDVIGNPFALMTGLTTGAKDLFYEPYQGLIQGPEEFAEGLALGVKSLVGHTIGGAAGAVSRITGTLGKGVAALTMDDEYKESRRQSRKRKPTSIKEGLSQGGKDLLEGVYGGVTGVVKKPMEGAKKSGAKGFFKGMGKGLVGVIARPMSGVVDFASSTLEGIKGTASGGRIARRVRPPRRFYADKIMRPYNRYEAEGVELLMEYSQGKDALVNDVYICHYFFPQNMALMITDKHVLLMRKETVIKEEWENQWFCNIKDLKSDPKVDGTKITFSTPEQGKMFKKVGTKVIDVKSSSVAEWIAASTIEARSSLR